MVENEILSTLGIGDPSILAANTGHTIFVSLMVIFWVAIVGGVVWFAIWYSSFKVNVIIREITNKRRYVTSDKAKVKILDGVEYYYLRSRRVYLNIPPPEALEITNKGKFFCECYHDGSAGKKTGYSWIKDDTNDLLNLDDDTFKPLSTQRQSQLVNRIRRAEARKGADIWMKAAPIVMSMVMVMMLAIPFIFYGELSKANTEAMQETLKITSMQAKMTEDLIKGMDILTGKLERDEFVFNQDLALDEQIKPAEVSG
jgi:hypothetical protein